MNRTFLIILSVAIIGMVAAVGGFIYWQQSNTLACLTVCGCGACQPTGREALSMDSFHLNSPTNVSLTLKNVGTLSLSLQEYFVKDSGGNQWQSYQWEYASTQGPTLSPNTVATAMITIGQSCSNCSYSGTPGAFSQFISGKSYTVEVVTARNNQFNFLI